MAREFAQRPTAATEIGHRHRLLSRRSATPNELVIKVADNQLRRSYRRSRTGEPAGAHCHFFGHTDDRDGVVGLVSADYADRACVPGAGLVRVGVRGSVVLSAVERGVVSDADPEHGAGGHVRGGADWSGTMEFLCAGVDENGVYAVGVDSDWVFVRQWGDWDDLGAAE